MIYSNMLQITCVNGEPDKPSSKKTDFLLCVTALLLKTRPSLDSECGYRQ